MSTAGRWVAQRLIDVAVVALAVLLCWPAPSRGWLPFHAPDVLQVQYPGGTGVAADVYTTQGRIGAKKRAALVFAWLQGPVSIDVTEPQGTLELLLGPPDGSSGSLKLDGKGLTFGVTGSAAAPQSLPVQSPQRLTLSYADGSYVAQVDGAAVGAAIPGKPPVGPANLWLWPGASVRSLACGTSSGEAREVEGEEPPAGVQRTLWAGLAALLSLVCLRAQFAQFARHREPAALGRAGGLIAGAALLAGVVWTLEVNNGERLAVPQERCTETPLHVPDAHVVTPGQPFDLGPRRDGDFVLRAQVTLEPGAALDLLVRAGLPRIDRQVLVTLSNDPDLASGCSRNLGTFLTGTPAPAALSQQPAGRRLALEVRCQDELTEARVDGELLASVRDLDLRTGRAAFHALAGRATVSDLSIEPLGTPRDLTGLLRRWQWGAGALVPLALVFIALRSGRGWGGLLWIWPLAAASLPISSPAFATPALLLAGVLLLLLPAPGRRVLTWGAGAVLIGLTWWAPQERAPEFSPAILTRMRPADVSGAPISARYLWARHPLCRRFNGYMKDQTLRNERVAADKPAGTLRVVTLGSSSTFGYGVAAPDTWSAQLQLLLQQRRKGEQVQVVNAGVPSGTAEGLNSYLQNVVLALHPDVVVIDLSFNNHILGGTQDERAHFAAMSSDGIGWLGQLWARWQADRAQRGWQAYVEAREAGGPADPAGEERYSLAPARSFQASIREMIEACRAAGSAVLLVAEPTRPGENIPIIEPYHAALVALGAALDVPVVSPQADLDRAGGELYVDVVHPNPAGHKIIARVVGSALVALLPAR